MWPGPGVGEKCAIETILLSLCLPVIFSMPKPSFCARNSVATLHSLTCDPPRLAQALAPPAVPALPVALAPPASKFIAQFID